MKELLAWVAFAANGCSFETQVNLQGGPPWRGNLLNHIQSRWQLFCYVQNRNYMCASVIYTSFICICSWRDMSFQSEFPILVFPTCHNLESIYLFSLIFLALLFIFYVLILDAFFLAGIFDPANLVFLLSSTGPRSHPYLGRMLFLLFISS